MEDCRDVYRDGSIRGYKGVNFFTYITEQKANRDKKQTIALLISVVVIAPERLSNTPVVLVMILEFAQLVRSLNIKASKLLIPLSYASILGGTLPLIGTSKNLLVDGVAR